MTRTSPGQEAGFTPGREPVGQIRPDPPCGEPLRVDVLESSTDGCTLRVVGEIDLATAGLLRSGVMEQLEQRPPVLVLDLSAVSFLGSSGLAVLVEVRTEAQRRDVLLQLITNSRAVLRALTATGLIDLFDVRSVG
jgi:anti-sigma B factor antagonist